MQLASTRQTVLQPWQVIAPPRSVIPAARLFDREADHAPGYSDDGVPVRSAQINGPRDIRTSLPDGAPLALVREAKNHALQIGSSAITPAGTRSYSMLVQVGISDEIRLI